MTTARLEREVISAGLPSASVNHAKTNPIHMSSETLMGHQDINFKGVSTMSTFTNEKSLIEAFNPCTVSNTASSTILSNGSWG